MLNSKRSHLAVLAILKRIRASNSALVVDPRTAKRINNMVESVEYLVLNMASRWSHESSEVYKKSAQTIKEALPAGFGFGFLIEQPVGTFGFTFSVEGSAGVYQFICSGDKHGWSRIQ